MMLSSRHLWAANPADVAGGAGRFAPTRSRQMNAGRRPRMTPVRPLDRPIFSAQIVFVPTGPRLAWLTSTLRPASRTVQGRTPSRVIKAWRFRKMERPRRTLSA